MPETDTNRALSWVFGAMLIGSTPLLLHQVIFKDKVVHTVTIENVTLEKGTACTNQIAVTAEGALSCAQFQDFSWDSVQEWAWMQQVSKVIQSENIEMDPLQLKTIQFYAGDEFGPLKYAIYRLLLSKGALDLSPQQYKEEIDYLLPELPFPIQGREGERLLRTVDEVVEWKTEVVQQAQFTERFVEYMLDIHDDLTIVSTDAWLKYDGHFSTEGNVLTQVLWQKNGCVIRNRWWIQVQPHSRLEIPLYGSPNLTKDCLNLWSDWIQEPSLDEVAVIVDWTGRINDESVQSKVRWRRESVEKQ